MAIDVFLQSAAGKDLVADGALTFVSSLLVMGRGRGRESGRGRGREQLLHIYVYMMCL